MHPDLLRPNHFRYICHSPSPEVPLEAGLPLNQLQGIGKRCKQGGATVLKVGDKFCERSEQKIFFDPHFLASGGQNIA